MTLPTLAEQEQPSLDAPIVRDGGCTVCPLLHFVNLRPVDGVPRAQELWAGKRPHQPIAAYLPWAFERMAGVVQTQLNAAPSPDRYLRGCAAGLLEASEDLDAMRPLAEALNAAGVILKIAYIDLETEPSVWIPSDHAKYTENWQVIVGVLTSPTCRATMPLVLTSIPPHEADVVNELQSSRSFGTALWYSRIAALDTWIKSLTLRSMHTCMKAAGLRVARVIVQSHHNCRVPLCENNGVPIAPCKLPPTFGSNLALTARTNPNKPLATAWQPMRGAAFAQNSTAPWAHIAGDEFNGQTPADVDAVLSLPLAGAIVFAPKPNDGAHLVDVLRKWTA